MFYLYNIQHNIFIAYDDASGVKDCCRWIEIHVIIYLVVQPKSLYFESCSDRFPQSVNLVRLTHRHRWWYIIRERAESLDDQMVTINTRRQYIKTCVCNDSVRIEYYFIINIISVCRLQIYQLLSAIITILLQSKRPDAWNLFTDGLV